MKKLSIILGFVMILGAAAVSTAAQSKVNVRFSPGKTIGYYNGSVRGARYIDYVMRAEGGQTLRVTLTKRSGSPTYFNVLRPGSDVAIADDARESQSWKGVLPEDGSYVVRVYLAKADRLANRTGAYKVGFSIVGFANAKPFSKTVSLYGVTFVVKSPNKSAGNTVTITSKGLTRNLRVTKSFDGRVLDCDIGDSNLDQSPELFVWGVSDGSGGYGVLIGYSANNKKSATEIYVPEMDLKSDMAKGYMGHDEFDMVENTLVRRFPVYKPGDSNAKATGGTRQFQYKVKAGEAGWVLTIDKWFDF